MPANKEQVAVTGVERLSGLMSGCNLPFVVLVPDESWLDPGPCSPETANLGSASSILLPRAVSPCAEIGVISWCDEAGTVLLGREEEELSGCRNDSPPANGATSVSRSAGQRAWRDALLPICNGGLL